MDVDGYPGSGHEMLQAWLGHCLQSSDPALADRFDTARIVVIRDGRDALLARHSRTAATFWLLPDAVRWSRAIHRTLDDPAILPVRYEDLRFNPDQTLRNLCDVLGIEADEGRVHAAVQSRGWDTVGRNGSVGAWRTKLGRWRGRLYGVVAASAMRRCGYLPAAD